MTRMYNPPHPGEVVRECLGNVSVTEAAMKLGVNRVTLFLFAFTRGDGIVGRFC